MEFSHLQENRWENYYAKQNSDSEKSVFFLMQNTHIRMCMEVCICVCIVKGGGGMYGERKGSKGKGAVKGEQEGNSGKKGKSHVFSHMWSLCPPSVCAGVGRGEGRKGSNECTVCVPMKMSQ